MATKKPTVKKNRKLQAPQYKSFRLQKRIKTVKPRLPTVRQLCRQTLLILRQNKKFFIIFTLVYAILGFIFVQGAATPLNLQEAKQLIGDSVGGTVPTTLALYVGLVGTSTQFSTQMAAFYQFILVLIFGLAVIYGLRYMYGKQARRVSVKESLYNGMTPLVPILLVLIVLTLQLLPLSIGSTLYATVVSNGLAITNVERIVWVIFVSLLGLLSLYMVSSSIFALFIVTLPNMTPMRALRASRELVRFRRLEVIRKIVFLPLILLLLLAIVVVPFIAWLPGVAQVAFMVASSLVLPVVLTYMYNLYRSML